MLNTILLTSFFMVSPVHMERPVLTLAQCYVESRFKSTAVGKKGEKGAFQVLEKYHGKVSKDPKEQLLVDLQNFKLKEQVAQYEYIMEQLMFSNKHDVSKAVKAYNGRGKGAKKYLCLVRKKALEIALI